MRAAPQTEQGLKNERLGDYHIYELNENITIVDRQLYDSIMDRFMILLFLSLSPWANSQRCTLTTRDVEGPFFEAGKI